MCLRNGQRINSGCFQRCHSLSYDDRERVLHTQGATDTLEERVLGTEVAYYFTLQTFSLNEVRDSILIDSISHDMKLSVVLN